MHKMESGGYRFTRKDVDKLMKNPDFMSKRPPITGLTSIQMLPEDFAYFIQKIKDLHFRTYQHIENDSYRLLIRTRDDSFFFPIEGILTHVWKTIQQAFERKEETSLQIFVVDAAKVLTAKQQKQRLERAYAEIEEAKARLK